MAATLQKITWTGGDTPSKAFKALRSKANKRTAQFKALRRQFFREYVQECGGLNLWKCAGTSSLERARIFWNRATLDAWRTLNP